MTIPSYLKHILDSIARSVGVKPVMLDSYHDMVRRCIAQRACLELLAFINRHPTSDSLTQEFVLFCGEHFAFSYSQYRQDLFVRWITHNKQSGFFVDIGGADGITNSNTAGFERFLGWTGLVFEPTPQFHIAKHSRRASTVINSAVVPSTNDSGRAWMTFHGQNSTLKGYSPHSMQPDAAENATWRPVRAMTFEEAMQEYFPEQRQIDYLSIDTEGSEFSILESIDLNKFQIRCITVEHNHRCSDLSKIRDLLPRFGFREFFADCAHITGVDAWFAKT